MSVKGSKLKVVKVKSPESGDFTETVKFELFHCNHFDGNTNKFYIIEIQKNKKDEYQLFSNYGRLGKTSIYETRTNFKGSDIPITKFDEIESEYLAIVAKKLRGKTTKGIKEIYTKVDVMSPTVGSSNILETSNVESSTNVGSFDNVEVARIITQLTNDNIHDILSKTSLTLTSRGLETDIGIVSESHIDDAVLVLNTLRDGIISKNDDIILESNNKYFSLIPNKFTHKLDKSDMIDDADKLSSTYELLDNLKAAIKSMVVHDKPEAKSIIDIDVLDDKVEYDRLSNLFESRKHSNHSHLNDWKIKNIFKFNEQKDKNDEYQKTLRTLGNENELFHGSRNSNILSILINGLIIPPASAGHCTGRMFGDGIYSASCSTKALNYSTGFWDNKGSNGNAFILITKFVMGNEQKLKSFKYNGADKGYDSVHGLNSDNGGTLLNDEYIVYSTKQVLITHLIELQK